MCLPFVFFFLRIRLPPISTLFPYTTLFRSGSKLQAVINMPNVLMEHATISKEILKVQDRKSTRLNSSHRCISYAVFCLKKKKKKKKTKKTKIQKRTTKTSRNIDKYNRLTTR